MHLLGEDHQAVVVKVETHRSGHLALVEQFHLAPLQGEEATHQSGELALLQGVAKIHHLAHRALAEQFHLAPLQGVAKIRR